MNIRRFFLILKGFGDVFFPKNLYFSRKSSIEKPYDKIGHSQSGVVFTPANA